MRRALTIMTTVAAVALCWPVAATTTGWTIQPTPTLPDGGGFFAVSCAAAANCSSGSARRSRLPFSASVPVPKQTLIPRRAA